MSVDDEKENRDHSAFVVNSRGRKPKHAMFDWNFLRRTASKAYETVMQIMTLNPYNATLRSRKIAQIPVKNKKQPISKNQWGEFYKETETPLTPMIQKEPSDNQTKQKKTSQTDIKLYKSGEPAFTR